MAQTSPALFPSTTLPSGIHSEEEGEKDQIWTSPPKPALAAKRPLREVQMWWQPSLWAEGRVWTSGMEGVVVEWTFREEEPEAERI
jgi:hypothetical protein